MARASIRISTASLRNKWHKERNPPENRASENRPAHKASGKQLIAVGRANDSRVVSWMATGSKFGGASTSAIGGLAAQLVVVPFAIAMTACNDDTNTMLQEANDAGRVIMKPFGRVVGAVVGGGLAGVVNLGGYLAACAYSAFSKAMS